MRRSLLAFIWLGTSRVYSRKQVHGQAFWGSEKGSVNAVVVSPVGPAAKFNPSTAGQRHGHFRIAKATINPDVTLFPFALSTAPAVAVALLPRPVRTPKNFSPLGVLASAFIIYNLSFII